MEKAATINPYVRTDRLQKPENLRKNTIASTFVQLQEYNYSW